MKLLKRWRQQLCGKQDLYIEEKLSRLYPGENLRSRKEAYYEEKRKKCLLAAFAGVLLGICMLTKYKGQTQEITTLQRGLPGTSGIEYRLETAEDKGQSYDLTVSSLRLKEEQLRAYESEFDSKILTYILGENIDDRNVINDLLLSEIYENYPFYVVWSSEKPEVIDSFGKVSQVIEPTKVILNYTLYYEEYSYRGNVEVTVLPSGDGTVSNEQRLQQRLKELEESNRFEETVELPTEWEGREIHWSEKKTNYSLYVFAGTPILVLLIYFLTDYDLQKKVEIKRGKLKRAYPELVHKLVILIGAGMSVRVAFAYLAQKTCRNREAPYVDEIRMLSEILRNGGNESSAYETFGHHTGVREYVRLGTLLSQNMKRGNDRLLERLLQEAENASEVEVQLMRKAGEEAGTKLLFPMVMYLGMIMVMILIPAFSSL